MKNISESLYRGRFLRRIRSGCDDVFTISLICLFLVVDVVYRSTLPVTYPVLEVIFGYRFAQLVVLAMICCLVVKQRLLMDRAGIWMVLALITATALSFSLTNDINLLIDVILIVVAARIDKYKLLRYCGMTLIVSVCIVVFSSIVGVTYNKDVIPNSFLVFSFGFTHPNTTGGYLISGLGALAVGYWKEKRWYIVSPLSMFTGLFAKLSLSSNATMAICIAIGAAVLAGHIKLIESFFLRYRKQLAVLLLVFLTVSMGVSMIVIANYNPDSPIMYAMNKLVHGRFGFASRYYNLNAGYTLFGRAYTVVSSYHSGVGFSSVDSGYASELLVYGLVPSACLLLLCTISVIKVTNKKIFIPMFFLFFLGSLYMFVETYPLFISMNVSMLLCSEALNEDSQSEGRRIVEEPC